MKILLGLDFAPDSKKAIRFLSGLKFPLHSEMSLVHIIKGNKELKHLGLTKDLESELRRIRPKSQKRAIQHLRRLEEKFIDHDLKIHVVVKEGNPGEEILSLLETSNMDLAVLGTRGLPSIKRFLLGGVSEWVLHEAPCPVLIVRGPARWAKGGMRVLMSTDGSPEAQAALEFLNQLSFPSGSEIILFHVVEPIDYTVVQDDFTIISLANSGSENLTHATQDIQKRVKQNTLSILNEAKKKIKGKRPKVEKISTGYAAEEIIKAAERFRADLIVMGSRGLSTVNRSFLGSVSNKVVRHAPCSVLVIRKTQKTGKIIL